MQNVFSRMLFMGFIENNQFLPFEPKGISRDNQKKAGN